MRCFIVCGMAACVGLTNLAAVAKAGEPPRLSECPELKDLVPRWRGAMESLTVPGFAVAIVKDGKVLALDAMGLCDPATGREATIDTMYYIASCTKPYTAAGVLALVGDGKLDLDAPVKKVLPRFDLADDAAAAKLTVRDLLCHRPGITNSAIVFNDAYTGLITDELFFKLLAETKPAGRPDYTNVHFTILGRVIEAVSGEPWRDYLDERIFRPAGMTRTTGYASRIYGDADAALPLELVDSKWVVCGLRKTDRTMHAAGGLGTTARDLARWMQLHLSGGRVNGKPVLPERLVKAMQEQQSEHDPNGSIRRITGFGLGWQVGTYRDRPLISHGGGYAGTGAYVAMLPKDGIGLALVVNTHGSSQAFGDVFVIDVIDRLLGLPHEDLLPNYVKRVAAIRQRMADAARARVDVPLQRPAASYAGAFENPIYGRLALEREGDRLVGRLGDLRLTFRGAEAGGDKFLADGIPDEPIDGRFEFDGDRCAAVFINNDDRGEAKFERQ